MGCSVIWAFFDIYLTQARDLFAGVVLVDQSPCMIADPTWTPEQVKQWAAFFSPSTAFEFGKDMSPATAGLIKAMFTAGADPKDVEFALERSSLMSDEAAAALLRDHASNDWRDVLPRFDIPALLVAAEGSLSPAEGVRWISEQMPDARLVTFDKEEGGSHFMFWETRTNSTAPSKTS
jgi:pimeloyl-ACP methyl ester carboxylesterase